MATRTKSGKKSSKSKVSQVPSSTVKRGKKKGPRKGAEGKRRNLIEVKAFCVEHEIPSIEVGSWVWTDFRKDPDGETVKSLKGFGFHKSHRVRNRKAQWAHDCGHRTRGGSKDVNPWDKYDVSKIV